MLPQFSSDDLEHLKNEFSRRSGLLEKDMYLLISKATSKDYSKGDFILQTGQIENHVIFITNGIVRLAKYNKDGKDFSIDFGFSGSFITSLVSFLDRIPSDIAIEAITDVSVLRLKHDELFELFETSHGIDRLGRILTEEVFKKVSVRLEDLIVLTATERYHKLLASHPELIQEIPLKYIASYLNITPETLSRVRKKSARNS
jgi:CRP/FNR family transcriptional regulator, anaerobic regulatory protein